MGDISKLPEDIYKKLLEAKEKTKDNTAFTVNLALNYGSRDEILRAVNILIEKGKKNVTQEEFNAELYTGDLPDPDFIIRTSGEQRLSNFMLYQVAYSEFYFPKVLWPDFNEKHLIKALKVYSKRDRRFGAVTKE